MITPLYSILPVTILVVVAAPGALADDESVPVEALTGGVPAGTDLRFAPGKIAVVASDAAVGAESIDVEPLAFALIAGDEAGYAPPTGNPLLSERWNGLTAARQTSEQIRAEMALGLTAGYDGSDAEELAYAIVLQINFQLARGETPDIQKSVANAKTGLNDTYRDRYVDPEAAAIVARVTGAAQVRFTPMTAGV